MGYAVLDRERLDQNGKMHTKVGGILRRGDPLNPEAVVNANP